jgi:hypothetical protein
MDAFQITFLILSVVSPAIPLWTGRNEKNSLLWLYVATGLSFDLLINVLKRLLHVNHYWAANLFVLTEFIFVSLIYRNLFLRNARAFYWIMALFIAYFLATTVSASIWKFNTAGASVFYFTYIIYSIRGLYRLLAEQKFLFLEQSREFWVHCAFLVYGSGNFLLFLFSDYLMGADNHLFQLLWSLFFLLINITLNMLLAIALRRKTLP